MSGQQEIFEITPTLLLRAYAAGVFPMSDSADAKDIYWVDPKTRGVLPLDGFHVPRSLAKRMRRDDYRVAVNSDFDGAVMGCAAREETWINTEIRDLYNSLHRLGYAHSIEVWMSGRLVGGLYGVALGGAFFGESMFSLVPDASKIALVHLVARLRIGGFTLLDTQFTTDHLARFGTIVIDRKEYLNQLDSALKTKADFYAMAPDISAQEVVQRSTQIS